MGRGIWLWVERPGCREGNFLYSQLTGSMGTGVIRISVVAKDRLKARKRADESFTDVIMRLTDRPVDVERFMGKYASVDLELV